MGLCPFSHLSKFFPLCHVGEVFLYHCQFRGFKAVQNCPQETELLFLISFIQMPWKTKTNKQMKTTPKPNNLNAKLYLALLLYLFLGMALKRMYTL